MCSWKWLSVKLPAANKWNCSQYGLIFITWKYNAMDKNRLWLQNELRHTWNVFVFTFLKQLLWWRDVLHIGWLAENLINQIVLIWTITSNLKSRSSRKVCWSMYYIFPGYKNINRLYGAMSEWLRCWIPSLGVPCTKPQSDSKMDLVFPLSEVDKMSTRNFWKLCGKK